MYARMHVNACDWSHSDQFRASEFERESVMGTVLKQYMLCNSMWFTILLTPLKYTNLVQCL